MSVDGRPEQRSPQDPIQYAPRRTRESPAKLPSDAGGAELRSQGNLVPAAGLFQRAMVPASHFLFREALRRPLDAQALAELSALAREYEGSPMLFGSVARLVAAVGFSAVVALLVAIMMPGFRQADTASFPAAKVQQYSAAPSVRSQDQRSSDEAAKPAITEFRSLLARSGEPTAPADRDQSNKLLQQFMQWQKKTPAEDAQK
ncbi:MAG: hypothetical protein JOY90_07140 [Bradyrhizobium sp.]|uniref:hypothetical protein n=1 Tax=Bradyrhizobium sp. TaxID=376 RepID=UPI001DA4EAAD|nr:hypothetical protein [Bradyrhizobium sp.]MBV9560221.1 hypothetical protein [Bradyrhizobium sp.]